MKKAQDSQDNIKFQFDLPEDKAQKLINAIQEGKFSEFGIISAEIRLLKDLLAENELEIVVGLIKDYLKEQGDLQDIYNEVITLESKHSRLKSNFSIQREEKESETTQIIQHVIAILDKIEKKITVPLYSVQASSPTNPYSEFSDLKDALDLVNIGFWEWIDSEEFYSDSWLSMLGYKYSNKTESLDFDWKSLLHPEDRTSALKMFRNFTQGKKLNYESLFRLQCNDGSFKWIFSRAQVISWNEKGKPYKIVGFHQDVEHELQISNKIKTFIKQQGKEIEKNNTQRIEEEKLLSELQYGFSLSTIALSKIKSILLSARSIENINWILELHDTINSNEIMKYSFAPESSFSSKFYIDFNLSTALNHLSQELSEIYKYDERTVDIQILSDKIPSVIKGKFQEFTTLISWLVGFVMKYTEKGNLILKVDYDSRGILNHNSINSNSKRVNLNFSISNTSGEVIDQRIISLINKIIRNQNSIEEFDIAKNGYLLFRASKVVSSLNGFLMTEKKDDKDCGLSLFLPLNY